MTLPKEAITRLRMYHQRMSAPLAGTVPDVVHWLGAVQAQDYAGAKWSLGLRLVDVKDDQVEQAFSTGSILRTHLLRPTWHFVTPADIRWLLALTAPRVRMVMQSTQRQSGIDDALVSRANQCFEKVLRDGGQLTRDELRTPLEQAGIEPGSGQRMSLLMMRAELDGVVCSGPRKGKQFTYMLLEERVPPARVFTRDEALAELASRFFHSRGPATVRDMAKWSGLTLSDARQGLEAVKHLLVEEPSGWMSASSPSPDQAGPMTHLVSVFDEYISGYQDHSAMVEPGFGDILRGLGNGLVNIILVDGQVVGAWRREERKNAVTIELNNFRQLNQPEIEAVKTAGHQYGRFFGKEVEFRERVG